MKPEIYRVAERHDLQVTLVAGSWMKTPAGTRVRVEVVAPEMNAADDWIADHVERGDIVITADIPLAARCLEKGARVLGSTGRPFTQENIGEMLATRNLLFDLRESRQVTGGPPPFKPADRSRFLQELHEMIGAIRRAGA